MSCAVLLTATISSLPVAATSVTDLIDNNPAEDMYTSTSYGFSTIYTNSCYRGDAQRCPNNSSNYYYWSRKNPKSIGGTKTVSVSFKAYLNDATFTDRGARYSVYKGGIHTDFLFTINQNSAPAGWGYTYTANIPSCTQIGEVRMKPSGGTGSYTGADAIQITYSY